MLEQKRACARSTSRLAHRSKPAFVVQEFDGVAGHRIHIADVGQIAAYAMFNHFRDAASAGRDGDDFTRHPFKRRQAEGFQFARHQQDVGDSELLLHLILLAQEENVLMDSFLHRQPFSHRTVGTVADQH